MSTISSSQPLIATFAGLAILLLLILRFRTNAFITLLATAIFTAIAAGLAPKAAFQSVQNGMGGTLGFIAPIIGLGAIFGAILEKSGATQSLVHIVDRFKENRTKSFATGAMGLIAATPVFFDVALILLLPFVLKLARKAKKVPLYFGLPLCAGLAIGHAFIPPTPGPIIIATYLGANLLHVISIGIIVGAICLIVAGPILTGWLDKTSRLPVPAEDANWIVEDTPHSQQVNVSTAITIMLLPIFLILLANGGDVFFPDNPLQPFLTTLGHPFSALIIACIVSWIVLGPKSEKDKADMRSAISQAFEPTALVILVTGAGGAFKQVLTDTGAGGDLASLMFGFGLTPVLLAFTLALAFRLLQGSATVAMTAGAGLLAPIIATIDVTNWQLAVLTLAVAAGATGFSHVNDSGFWLINRLFNLTEKETLKTWTLMTGVISVTALILCLILYPIFG